MINKNYVQDMPKDMYLPMLVSALLAFLTSFLGGSAFGKVQQQNKLDVSELLSTNYIPSVILVSKSGPLL